MIEIEKNKNPFSQESRKARREARRTAPHAPYVEGHDSNRTSLRRNRVGAVVAAVATATVIATFPGGEKTPKTSERNGSDAPAAGHVGAVDTVSTGAQLMDQQMVLGPAKESSDGGGDTKKTAGTSPELDAAAENAAKNTAGSSADTRYSGLNGTKSGSGNSRTGGYVAPSNENNKEGGASAPVENGVPAAPSEAAGGQEADSQLSVPIPTTPNSSQAPAGLHTGGQEVFNNGPGGSPPR